MRRISTLPECLLGRVVRRRRRRRRAGGHGCGRGGLAGAGTEAESDETEGDHFDELHGYKYVGMVLLMLRTQSGAGAEGQ